ncbi:phage baseplate protein [Staphylococcus xylosus]
MAYTTNLHSVFDRMFISQVEYNFEFLYKFRNDIMKSLQEHKDAKIAHKATQISYGDEPLSDFVAFLNGRMSNLVIGHNGDGVNEVTDARTDNLGVGHPTLQDRLRRDYLNYMIDKKAVIDKVETTRKELMDIEYRFDPLNQEPQFITDLSPYTNAVMQSFWIDPYTHIIYMTQARPGNHYMLTRLKPNGQYIDRLLVKNGGHGTHNAYRYIDGQLWIYSGVLDSNKNTKFVRFKYKTGEIVYGSEMQDVMPSVFNTRYTTPIYNPKEDLLILRREYTESEKAKYQAMNFVEIRNMKDIDNGVDRVLYKLTIPGSYTTPTQPMQGITYDNGILYWYTGDSNPSNPNYLLAYDVKTNEQLWRKRINIGGINGRYTGNFQEAEGMSMYYDHDTGKKALLLGVTTGPGNNRHHEVYSIGQRDVNEILKNRVAPVAMYETGGRTKPMPIQGTDLLSKVTEIGHYYLYTSDSLPIADFPLSKVWKDAGWFLDVYPGHGNGGLRQVLTRNSTGRNMLRFERVTSAFDPKASGPWNFVPLSAGKWERIPKSITLLKDLDIVGMTFYITTDESKRFTDFPKDFKGVAGWILEVKGNSTGAFTHVLRRNNYAYHHQFLVKNYAGKNSSKWSLFEGKEVN